MRNLPVHWAEGMFLRPQHFQAADRHWTEQSHLSSQLGHSFHYGLERIGISTEAIANTTFQLEECFGRMQDGTIISILPGKEPDRVDLQAAFEKESAVTAYLAIPKLKMGAVNVAPAGPRTDSRYTEELQKCEDESQGGSDEEIAFRIPNFRVLLSTEDRSGYELLPIARILRSGERDTVPQLDQTYIPPLLDCDAWRGLGRDILVAIYDLIGQKIDVLATQVNEANITFSSQQPGDMERLVILSELNRAYVSMGIWVFTKGIHPFFAYTECGRILGSLAVFGPHRRVPETPAYNHDDLYTIFTFMLREIKVLLRAMQEPTFDRVFFEGEGVGMSVTLKPEWLGEVWNWYVGVLCPSELKEHDCIRLLSKSGGLDWKLGAATKVDHLFKLAAEGLRLEPLQQTPRELPSGQGWLYFKVSRDNNAWKDVYHEQTLAMRLNRKLIVNLDNLQGKRQLIVRVERRQVPLEFALFAVEPNRGGS